MLINLRNALMAGKRLQYDAEVEYIESTGTQWIDTGIVPSFNTRIEATVQALAAPTIVSTGATSNGAVGITYWGSPLSWATKFGDVGYTPAQGIVRISTSAIYQLSLDKSNFTVNGTDYPVNATSLSASSSLRILYDIWNAGLDARVYNLKIYESATLVRDFIPVRKGTTGYLYDRVSGKLFGNAGTGDFVLGQDVVPVEYIESHGTEYIDIPVSGTPDEYFGIKGLVKITNTSQSGNAFWDTNTYRQFGASGYRMEGDGYMFVSWVGSKSVNGGWTVLPGVLYPFEVSTLGRTFLGEFQPLPRNITSAFSTLRLFGKYSSYNVNASVAFGTLTITDGTGNARNFLPVRVGTDATSWEGALMDTLTRRIYRNAGTGAFGYGNDLKYPIPA